MLNTNRETGASHDPTVSVTSCPPPARFWAVVLGRATWNPDERRHIADCPQCRLSERQVQEATGAETSAMMSTELTLADATEGNALDMSTMHLSASDLADTTMPPDSVASWTSVALGTPSLPQTLGDYDLIRRIGYGGMGVVYLARDRRLNRLVALKSRLSFGRDENYCLDRFLSEARVLAQLDHPSILPIHEVGQHGDATYIVTPFIEGQSLASLLSTSGPLPGREAAQLIAQIADAVDHVHRCGIIHRDIKPSNILLNVVGRPILMDFGLAKAEEDEASLSRVGQVLGTPAYMSPEQASCSASVNDPRTDIYSLGATLYALLTGGPPFKGSSALDTLRRLLDEEPPRPRLLNPAVDNDLEAICLKALQREPAQRYVTAHDLAEDLRRYLRGEPTVARPPGVSERALRYARRHLRSTLLTLVTVGGLILVGLAWRQGPTKSIPRVTISRLRPAQPSINSSAIRPSPPPAIAPADLASALNDLGRLYRDLDRPTEAEAAYRRSAAILLQLTRVHPETAAYSHGLADAYQNLAALLRARHHLTEADTIDQAARALLASRAGDRQDSPVPPPSLDPFPR